MNSSVKRFRFMAIVAGVMSLLLWFVDLPVAYLFDNPDWKSAVAWILLYMAGFMQFMYLSQFNFQLKPIGH